MAYVRKTRRTFSMAVMVTCSPMLVRQRVDAERAGRIERAMITASPLLSESGPDGAVTLLFINPDI